MKIAEIYTEARDPMLNYKEVKAKGALDKVIVELKGKQSEKFTKLAKRFKECKDMTKELELKKAELDAELKEDLVTDLFDAQDEIYTRVVDTVSMTLTLSKKTVRTTAMTDYDAILEELSKMVPELTDKIAELKKQYTRIEIKPVASSLRPALKEGVGDKVTGLLQKLFGLFLKTIKLWGRKYDHRLAALRNSI
jgi:hypothetical protein